MNIALRSNGQGGHASDSNSIILLHLSPVMQDRFHVQVVKFVRPSQLHVLSSFVTRKTRRVEGHQAVTHGPVHNGLVHDAVIAEHHDLDAGERREPERG